MSDYRVHTARALTQWTDQTKYLICSTGALSSGKPRVIRGYYSPLHTLYLECIRCRYPGVIRGSTAAAASMRLHIRRHLQRREPRARRAVWVGAAHHQVHRLGGRDPHRTCARHRARNLSVGLRRRQVRQSAALPHRRTVWNNETAVSSPQIPFDGVKS